MLGIVDGKCDGAITGPELDQMDDDESRQAGMAYNVSTRVSP